MEPECGRGDRVESRGHQLIGRGAPDRLALDEEGDLVANRATALGRDLGAVAGTEKGHVSAVEERHESVERGRQALRDYAECDRQLAVGCLACRRETWRPSVLVTIQHHKADLSLIRERGQSPEQDRTVSADQQRSASASAGRTNPLARRLDQPSERGLVQQPGWATLATGRVERKIPGVRHAEGCEALGEAVRTQDPDGVGNSSGPSHRRVRDSGELPSSCHRGPTLTANPEPALMGQLRDLALCRPTLRAAGYLRRLSV